MSTFSVVCHESKLAYAIVHKCLDIHEEAWAVRIYGLKPFFPKIETEWRKVFDVLRLGVSAPITWTGQSMTKADSVPDDTRTPPQIEINGPIIRAMHGLAVSSGVSLNKEAFEFFDNEDDFREAVQTWTGSAKMYLDIMSLAQEFTMYRLILSDFYRGTGTIERSPGQLVPFTACPAPVANNDKMPDSFNWAGILAACGDYYKAAMFSTALDVLAAPPGSWETTTTAISVPGVDNPADPGVTTLYEFEDTAPLIGVISIENDGTFYTDVAYENAKASVVIPEPVATAPASVTMTIHTMRQV